MKAVAGLIPLYDTERESYWMLPGYMKMLEEQGAVPLMLPLTDDQDELGYFLSMCDGILLTGGQDVAPEIYGAVRQPGCGEICDLRDRMEQYVFSEAVASNKAVLGICRGIQCMNAFCGGTLYQDLPSEHASAIAHNMTSPYDRVAHYVDIVSGTPLHGILGADRIGVNSLHHQAIRELAPGLETMGISEDGLIESVFMPDRKFVVGVQWHPEYSYASDRNSRLIVRAFIDAMKRHL